MATNELMKDFLSFLRKPDTKQVVVSKKQGLIQTIRLWRYLFISIVFGGILVDSLVDIPQHNRVEEVIELIGIAGFIGFAVFLGPLLEEVAFRLMMRFRLRYMVLGTLVLAFYLIQFMSTAFEENNSQLLPYFYGVIGFLALSFLGYCFKYRETMAKWWIQRFPIVFYVLSVTFGLIHLFNFQEFPLKVILLAPIITLPQLILGVGMGYLRMRFGFWYGYLFHVLNNGFAVSVYLLLQ